MKKQENGITLIALVVTIIVLLILAGIAINLTIGNNGLFIRAQNAANTWRRAEENEEREMKNFEILYDTTIEKSGIVNNNENIEFSINGEQYTVKNGTTWNDFFSENFPNDWSSWMYLTDENVETEKRGCVVNFIETSNGLESATQAWVSYLKNESNELQYKDDMIKNVNYKYNKMKNENDGTWTYSPFVNIFGTE